MSRTSHAPVARRLALAGVFVVSAVAIGSFRLAAVRPASADPVEGAPAKTPPKEFRTTQEAAAALVEAAAKNDDAALTALAGSEAGDVVQSGRDPQVQKDRAAFAVAARTKLSFEEKDGEVTLVVGDEEWPFPIPLVKSGDAWHFDAAEGREEILARRIGRNELRAIQACRDYVAAQIAYASKDRDGDKVREYAERLVSTPGTHDGLYWPTVEGGEASPLANALAPFRDYVAAPSATPTPFMGYVWRVLYAQGPHAPGGAYCYRINGNLIAGFALIGVPAVYRNTGITTLIVSHQGTVYQKDLGPGSLAIASAIDAFDPDETWTEVSAEDLAASAR